MTYQEFQQQKCFRKIDMVGIYISWLIYCQPKRHYWSTEYLASKTKLSRATISRKLKELEENKIISRTMPPAKRYYLTYFVAELQNPIIKEIHQDIIDYEKHKRAYDNLFNSNK